MMRHRHEVDPRRAAARGFPARLLAEAPAAGPAGAPRLSPASSTATRSWRWPRAPTRTRAWSSSTRAAAPSAGSVTTARSAGSTPACSRRATGRCWCNGVESLVPGGWELLRAFSFIPAARIDDLMVSYAADGGSVGPHDDLYDVFLLQGPGRRRWQVSDAARPRARPGAPRSRCCGRSCPRTNGCSSRATCCTCRPASPTRAWPRGRASPIRSASSRRRTASWCRASSATWARRWAHARSRRALRGPRPALAARAARARRRDGRAGGGGRWRAMRWDRADRRRFPRPPADAPARTSVSRRPRGRCPGGVRARLRGAGRLTLALPSRGLVRAAGSSSTARPTGRVARALRRSRSWWPSEGSRCRWQRGHRRAVALLHEWYVAGYLRVERALTPDPTACGLIADLSALCPASLLSEPALG